MTKKDFAIAVNKFFYYAMNYKCVEVTYKSFNGDKTEYLPAFFKDNIFHCNTAHMVGKWKGAIIKKYDKDDYPIYNDSYGVMMRFYAELDGNNRASLLAWICENYQQNDDFGISLATLDNMEIA